MKSMIVATTCILTLAAVTNAAPKDITTRTNPDSTLNVEARYLVHVGFSAFNAGLTSAVSPLSRGLMEYHSSGGLSGNWGRVNNAVTTHGGDGAFTPNTFGGANPDYAGYLFNHAAKNITAVKFWNTITPPNHADAEGGVGGGGTFAATPAVQYLDGINGTWHTISDVTWTPAYDPALSGVLETRAYDIAINEPLSGVWGIRLIGDGNAAGANTVDPTGWVNFQELAVFGELDIGDIDLTRNLALTGFGIVNFVHAPSDATLGANCLTDGNLATRVDTWGGGHAGEDFMGVQWVEPQYRVAAMGVAYISFGDGGIFDECEAPSRVEYTTDGVTWTPVSNLDKARYPTVWQDISYLGQVQFGMLYKFDEISGVLGLRIIGQTFGISGDRNGFLGAYEVEAFGLPVLVRQLDVEPDGDLDVDDAKSFQACVLAADIATTPACLSKDIDGDGDVDQIDYGYFQLCVSGPGIPYDPACDPVSQ